MQLLRTEYCLRLPAGWREIPAVSQTAQARITTAQAAGLTLLVERYNYRWTPERGMPARPGRLEFRPEPDDAVILDVFRRVHKDSLDAHARRAITASGLDAAAQQDLDNLRWMPSPREWWRLACIPGGDLVGLTAPCRNYHDPVIGYIAVVPEHRGHGYAYDLLAEATHLLVGEGGSRARGWSTSITSTASMRTSARSA